MTPNARQEVAMQFVTMTCEHLGQRSELREAIVKMMGHVGEAVDLIG
jgi:hypothetical protein